MWAGAKPVWGWLNRAPPWTVVVSGPGAVPGLAVALAGSTTAASRATTAVYAGIRIETFIGEEGVRTATAHSAAGRWTAGR